MNPVDALPRDYGLYYDNTFMWNTKRDRAVYVTLGEGGGLREQLTRQGRKLRVDPEDLKCWWPKSGAYNINGQGVYIARRARRNMKKSPYDHYYVLYGDQRLPGNILWEVLKGQNQLGIGPAMEVLDKRLMRSVAVAHDLILLARAPGVYRVVYKGIEAGNIVDGAFRPTWNDAPASKRVAVLLAEEGIECI